eukprot:11650856-Ditylum_brightwellii.AAC.1
MVRNLNLLRKSLFLKPCTHIPSIVRIMQQCIAALKRQSGALSMPHLSSHSRELKMEEGLWPQLYNNLLELINGKQSCPGGT